MKPIQNIKDVLKHTALSTFLFAFVTWLLVFFRCNFTYDDTKVSKGAVFAMIMGCYAVFIFVANLWELFANKNIKWGKLSLLRRSSKLGD